jgi:hypothetical protein
MKRRAPKNIIPVVVGLLIVVVGSMMWNIQESFISRRVREGATGSKKIEASCSKDSDCKEGKQCKDNVCS